MLKNLSSRFDWLSFYAVAGSLLSFCALLLRSADGGTDYVPIAVVVGLILAVRIYWASGRRLSVAGLLVIHLVSAWWLLANYLPIRDALRRTLWSDHYKSALMAQHSLPVGDLRHVEWDGWGFAGAGHTTVYLVYDPRDLFAVAAQGKYPDDFFGLPANAAHVRRLEKSWYAVRFFTDTTWDTGP